MSKPEPFGKFDTYEKTTLHRTGISKKYGVWITSRHNSTSSAPAQVFDIAVPSTSIPHVPPMFDDAALLDYMETMVVKIVVDSSNPSEVPPFPQTQPSASTLSSVEIPSPPTPQVSSSDSSEILSLL
ncbi:hypothetical protein U1Q18_028210 [Sarracenia purpurea var. burkii]